VLGLLSLTCFALQAQDTALIPLAYLDDPGTAQWDTHILDAHTGERLYELAGEDRECPVSLSPDGHWLLYKVGGFIPNQISWLLNMASKERISVRPLRSTAWSGDGRYLAYSTSNERLTPHSIYVYDTTNGEERHLEEISVERASEIIFQWTGNTLTYAFHSGTTLYLRRYEGDNLEQLTFDIPVEIDSFYNASISPDGRSLAVTAVENELSQVYVLDITTSDWQRISALETGGREPGWSPDGQYLAFVTGYDPVPSTEDSGTIYIWSKDGGALTLFYDSPFARIDHIDWSPDGQYISFREFHLGGTYSSNYTLLVKGINADESREISRFVDVLAGDMQWVSPTELVYLYRYSELLLDSPEAQNDLYRHNVTTQESVRLTQTPVDEFFQCYAG
jgi:Tol biopolymer transport system component